MESKKVREFAKLVIFCMGGGITFYVTFISKIIPWQIVRIGIPVVLLIIMILAVVTYEVYRRKTFAFNLERLLMIIITSETIELDSAKMYKVPNDDLLSKELDESMGYTKELFWLAKRKKYIDFQIRKGQRYVTIRK
ncbi:hypothetical protein [Culicoidibacter larvae]|uniref:Uncharacterized protein n=1 Tax=Culicoidibacter larvae TaxID=2579976 RepID=A0A5R8Q8T3_9FIRM|nr:hypothetical protein [Culicoidibacter larvae]TLG72124.1 hypothetical protein FEZ08_09855 [Culicoidibacter larvae]